MGGTAVSAVLLFVHGWGFDGTVWDAVRGHLSDIESVTWDLGFFGPPACPVPPAGRPVIAVGHSFGLLWLLKHRPFEWRALAAINGFARFTKAPDFADGVDRRVVLRMARDCADDAARTVGAFRARCGVADAAPPTADRARLAAALDTLLSDDGRQAGKAPVDLALCGVNDPIVPPTMSRASFAAPLWHAGGHLLPHEDSAWCAAHLRVLWESRT